MDIKGLLSTKIIFVVLLLLANTTDAQTIERSFDNYYNKTLSQGKRAPKFPKLRESDIVWERVIWRTIDLREKVNQFFYLPYQQDGVHGRKNFAYMLWDAVKANEVIIFEDDELKIPIDCEEYVRRYVGNDTIWLEIIDENEEYHYQGVPRPKEFNSEVILQLRMKEVWYIEKNETRQGVRLLALCMVEDQFRWVNDEEIYMGSFPLFWLPLQSQMVRDHLAQHEAYYEDNIAHLPSWQFIIENHMYSSFITRESNRFNRSISDYLTGSDAIWKAHEIEEELYQIESDMWEY